MTLPVEPMSEERLREIRESVTGQLPYCRELTAEIRRCWDWMRERGCALRACWARIDALELELMGCKEVLRTQREELRARRRVIEHLRDLSPRDVEHVEKRVSEEGVSDG